MRIPARRVEVHAIHCARFAQRKDLRLRQAKGRDPDDGVLECSRDLSPSAELRDRGEKLEAYELIPSLEEVVFVSHEERRIEVQRRGVKGWSCDVSGADDATLIRGVQIPVATIYG